MVAAEAGRAQVSCSIELLPHHMAILILTLRLRLVREHKTVVYCARSGQVPGGQG